MASEFERINKLLNPFGSSFGGLDSTDIEVPNVQGRQFVPDRIGGGVTSVFPQETTVAPTAPRDIEVAPGITALAGTPVPVDENVTASNQQRALLSEISNPASPITEVNLPDGTRVKGVDSVTPVAPVSPTTTPSSGVDTAPQDPGFLTQLGEFADSPAFASIFGQIAQAIVPDKEHGVNIAGQIGQGLGTSQAFDQYKEDIAAGVEPDRFASSVLSPEMKSQALKDVLTERRSGVTEDLLKAQTEGTKAGTAGTLTVEEKQQEKELDRNLRLEVAETSNNRIFTGLGQGYVLNAETGEVHKGADFKTGTGGRAPIGNLNSASYDQFIRLSLPPFIQLAEAAKRKEVAAAQGEEFAKTVDLVDFFKKDDGSVNFQAVMKYLNPQQTGLFGNQVQQYTENFLQGAAPTQTFQQQSQNFINTPDGLFIKNPDGSLTGPF